MADNKGARSYKGEVIGGDSFAITLNFKWLLQIIAGTAILVYSFWQLESRIQELERNEVLPSRVEELERNMTIALEEIDLHEAERKIAEEEHIKMLESQMKEQTVWIEQELGINLNPFSWGKKKK